MNVGKIQLEKLEFYAKHGCHKEERTVGNRYSIDLSLEMDLSQAIVDDKLSSTVDYEEIYKVVKKVMSEEANLLEYLAGKIIKELKTHFIQIRNIEVKISKHNPPINGICKRATVLIEG